MAGRDATLSSSDISNEEGWEDATKEDDEEECLNIVSLLDDRVFSDALSMVDHCKEKHNFDFLAVRDRLGLDFHGSVKLINFVRQHVREGQALPSEVSQTDIEDDRYLRPVLENDGLIVCLDDLPESTQKPSLAADGAPSGEASDPAFVESLKQRNLDLQAELERLDKQFSNYRLAVQQTLDQRWGDADDAAGSSKRKESDETGKAKDNSAYYFESYAQNDIHETMLKDTIRTDAYRDFVYNNKDIFAGKTVLDIGCGTGILSMFCAKAGAKQVIAVDKSEILDKAQENIFHNGLSDKIMCLKGKIEEVVLPVAQVDIIVSEWMGYCLLYEAMLPSVIYARDRYLKPDGLLVPSHATIWMAPVADPEYIADHITFWRDVYGFDMKAMQEGIYRDVVVDTVPDSTICGSPSAFRFLDLHTTTVEELVFRAPWRTKLSAKFEALDGFLLWFDIFFATTREDQTIKAGLTAQEWSSSNSQERVSFTTGPHGKWTHWKQGMLLRSGNVSQPKLAAGEELKGEISYAIPDGHARGLNIEVTWAGADDHSRQSQTWLLH